MKDTNPPEVKYEISSDDGKRLIYLLQDAHYQAGMNNQSLSLDVFQRALVGSGNATQAVAAGLLSTGVKHGPITDTREMVQFMLKDPDSFGNHAYSMIAGGCYFPGLGNSFFKDQIDPAFQEVNDFYRQLHMENDLGVTYVDTYARIVNNVVNHFRKEEYDKKEAGIPEELIMEPFQSTELFPNAALITAGITEFLGAKPNFENWFFISGRTRAWLEQSGDICQVGVNAKPKK